MTRQNIQYGLLRGIRMITDKQLREYLQAKPFRPFRIFLSDGSHHHVPHPEFAWVFGTTIFVGVAGKSTKVAEDYVKQLSLLDVTRIERLRLATSR